MTESGHWPFGGAARALGGKGSHTPNAEESEKALMAKQAALRQRMRHDRLIVGGRAHTKKQGLS